MQHIARGRRIVAAYIVAHLLVTATIIAFGVKFGFPLKRTLIGAIFQAMLVHRLWRGSRWAQWIQVLNFASIALVVAAFCFKRPHPAVLTVGIPVVLAFVWLGWMFGFSRSVRDFLAFQRGELGFAPGYAPARSPVMLGAPALATAEGSWTAEFTEARSGDFDDPTVSPCGACGRLMKNFVVLCPDCGTRRELAV